MQKLIQISSKNRHDPDNTNANNFQVNLGTDNKMSTIRACAVKEVQFTNAFYNINAHNNTFFFRTGGVEKSISIANGQYSIDEVIAELITGFAAQVPSITFTAALFENTNKLNMDTDIGISWSKYRYSSTETNPMAKVLGINTISDAEVTNHLASGLPDLSGIKSVYIISPQLAGGACISSLNGGQKLSLLDSVPNDVPFGSIKNHSSEGETDSHIYEQDMRNNLSTIDIQVKDEDNNLIDMNGTEIVILLKVFY